MLKTILKPLASLRLTVVLLSLAFFLVYAGTWAQVSLSTWEVQNRYFYDWIVRIPIEVLFKTSTSSKLKIPGAFYFPGGYLLGVAFLVNLIAAHSVRFKMTLKDLYLIPSIAIFSGVYYYTRNWEGASSSWALALGSVPFLVALVTYHSKRTGIILIHIGLILLLIGEFVSSKLKVECHMDIEEGSYAQYSYNAHEVELAIVDKSDSKVDRVVVVPGANLMPGKVLNDQRLPFPIRIEAYYENSAWYDAGDRPMEPGPRATAGLAAQQRAEVRKINKYAGTGESASKTDMPGIYATPLKDGKPTGMYVTRLQADGNEEINYDGKKYAFQLRPKRYYKSYRVYLNKFSFDRYEGTNMDRNYSSDIRLVDPEQREDRSVRIWMNHPLRYKGETFFQASFDAATERATVLQVVANPAWRLPYVSCVIGGAGLLIHFGIVLVGFIIKRSAILYPAIENAKVVGAAIGATETGRRNQGANVAAKKTRPGKKAAVVEPTDSSLRDFAIPLMAGLFTLAYVITGFFPAKGSAGFHIRDYAELPVLIHGRVQPLDTAAMVAMKSIHHSAAMKVQRGDEKRTLTPVEWMMDLQFDAENAANYKVFRIDFPDIAGRLTKEPGVKYFSLNEIFARWHEFGPEILKINESLKENPEVKLTTAQQELQMLGERIQLYLYLGGPENVLKYKVYKFRPELQKIFGLKEGQDLYSSGDIRQSTNTNLIAKLDKLAKSDDPRFETERRKAIALFDEMYSIIHPFEVLTPARSMPVVPVEKNKPRWLTLEQAENKEITSEDKSTIISAYSTMRNAFNANSPMQFNLAVDQAMAEVKKVVPNLADKAQFEARFNAFAPFWMCVNLYVIVFILVCLSWLTLSKALYRSAAAILVISLLVHTCGLIARIYISGRPPVTNLTSAAIFIAWAAILLAIGLEFFYRNTLGLLVASMVGFCSLLVADGLTYSEGDTMKVLRAVLDTNYWLATHVVCVTIGYATTILAGFLGVIYIMRGLFTSTLTKEDSKELTRMIYGTVCFAMFFSFVGTVLGGIWADQSWGRFWGWDSKENGAVLVVIANALLLHARWGGLIRDRGIAVLSVFGIAVTEWSYFGTNQLGVGLHAYGFTQGKGIWFTLIMCWLVQLVIIALGLIPVRLWCSDRNLKSAI